MYVDDFTLIYNNKEAYHEILSRLKKKFEIETSNSGKLLNITIKTFEPGLDMSQAEYIEKLLEKYNMRECNSVITPVSGEDKAFLTLQMTRSM